MADRHRILELDARSLRALAHPLRMRMLGLLRSDGPSTASRLADELGERSGTTSWHLRRLAEHGFIEEDTERGNGRDRWWRAAHDTTAIAKARFLDDTGSRGALDVVLRSLLDEFFEHAAVAVSELPTWDPEWVAASGFSDSNFSLTAPELEALKADIRAVLERYEREPREGDRTVEVQLLAFPRPVRTTPSEQDRA